MWTCAPLDAGDAEAHQTLSICHRGMSRVVIRTFEKSVYMPSPVET